MRGYADGTGDNQNGAGLLNLAVSPIISNCIIKENYAANSGGGIYLIGNPMLKNCILCNNSAGNLGGAIYAYACSAKIQNCTISRNTAQTQSGGGLYLNDCGNSQIVNTICYGNTAVNSSDIAVETVWPAITYSDFSISVSGIGNLVKDPLFADPINSDFHLKSAGGRWTSNGWVYSDGVVSPCINAGVSYSENDSSSFYFNEPWNNGLRINMGAYGNTNQASITGYGTVIVKIYPNNAKWRLSNEATWRSSGYVHPTALANGAEYSTGIYFSNVSGYKTPLPLSIRIYPNTTTSKIVNYEPNN
jgi:parallel beta-helix repeat protein/predicted outer membrane repeat protein